MEEPQPPKKSRVRLRRWAIVAVIVVVGYVAVNEIPLLIVGPVLKSNNFEGFLAGSGEQDPPHLLYILGNLTINSTSYVYGTFSGTSPLIFIAFNQEELNIYKLNRSITPNLYQSSVVLSGSANFTANSGLVYLTIYNPDNSSTVVTFNFKAVKAT